MHKYLQCFGLNRLSSLTTTWMNNADSSEQTVSEHVLSHVSRAKCPSVLKPCILGIRTATVRPVAAIIQSQL